jgi:hypothetical protein
MAPSFAVVYLGTERVSGGLVAYVYSVRPGWRIRWTMAPGPQLPAPDDANVLAAVADLAKGLPA